MSSLKKYRCYVPAYLPRIIEAKSAAEATEMCAEQIDEMLGSSCEEDGEITAKLYEEPVLEREWECTDCGHRETRDYDTLAADGLPICPKCDDEMSLIANH